MKTGMIMSGGNVNSDFALAFMKQHPYEYLIGVDRGIEFLQQQNLRPTHIVGDFDSSKAETLYYFKQDTQIKIQKFPPEKDLTDTQIAIALALTLCCETIYILGGTGTRIDHTMANICALAEPAKQGVRCFLVDEYNFIQVTKEPIHLQKTELFGRYISLFALGEDVTGLTLTGFKYPLTEYRMAGADSVGVSNEIVAETGKISFSSGVLVVAQTTD